MAKIEEYLKKRDEISGWFFSEDVQVFMKLNTLQTQLQISGNLLEIGAYCGKSAILMGYFSTLREQFTVCDLFGANPDTVAETKENQEYYGSLTYETFEKNYLRFHEHLPTILRCSSTHIGEKCRDKTFRMIHIDGSHQYDVVRHDIAMAKKLLMLGGIVIFDDYRSFHTPGVAAAVWQEVANGSIHPVLITSSKMYALTDVDQYGILSALEMWGQNNPDIELKTETVYGQKFLRVVPRKRRVGLIKRIYWEVRAARRQQH